MEEGKDILEKIPFKSIKCGETIKCVISIMSQVLGLENDGWVDGTIIRMMSEISPPEGTSIIKFNCCHFTAETMNNQFNSFSLL